MGSIVLLRLQPYRPSSVQKRTSQKLASRYFGPFKVLRQIGLVSYELDLPSLSKIHPVVHVSQLRRFHGSNPVSGLQHLPSSSDPAKQDTRVTDQDLEEENNVVSLERTKRTHHTDQDITVFGGEDNVEFSEGTQRRIDIKEDEENVNSTSVFGTSQSEVPNTSTLVSSTSRGHKAREKETCSKDCPQPLDLQRTSALSHETDTSTNNCIPTPKMDVATRSFPIPLVPTS